MLKNIFVASLLLITSMASHAALIEYNGYSRGDASNIVTGGGLEWLKWDLTKGMSINSALAEHSSDGWVLASNIQMASMFNSFQFGKVGWTGLENLSEYYQMGWSADEDSPHNYFKSLFGVTATLGVCSAPEINSCFLAEDPFRLSSAWYGAEVNGSLLYTSARVRDDLTQLNPDQTLVHVHHFAELGTVDYDSPDMSMLARGVALVRNKTTEPTQVPLPGSLSLLALGLVVLGYRRRQAVCSKDLRSSNVFNSKHTPKNLEFQPQVFVCGAY